MLVFNPCFYRSKKSRVEQKMIEASNCKDNLLARHHLLLQWQKIFIVFYSTIINGLFGFIANLLAIVMLVKTKQTTIPCMKIMLYLSITNVCLSVNTPILESSVLLIETAETTKCRLEVATIATSIFLGHLSAHLFLVMSYDRYICVKALTEYRSKMSRLLNRLVLLSFTLAALMSILVIAGGYTFEPAKVIFFVTVNVIMSCHCLLYTSPSPRDS